MAIPDEVFLSHSSQDQEFATNLVDVLRRHGVPVWYSRTNMIGAQPADKLQLIERLLPQIAQALPPGTPAAAPFPVMTISASPPDLPMRREELYGERGR